MTLGVKHKGFGYMRLFQYLSIISIILFWSLLVFAVNDIEFENLMSSIGRKDYAYVEEFLESNKSTLNQDPEYYVILLNYVISKGDKSGIVVAKGSPKPGDLELLEKDTGEVVGFIGSRGGYDEDLIVDGITQTQSALKFFRYRLDIHFGIVSVAERIQRWDIVGEQLVKVLETSKEIKNKWTWGSINSMEGDPEEFMIQNILPRTSVLFRADNPTADEALMNVSQAMIEYYPDKIYGYANLGVLYLARKKYDLAENYFKQALKIDPNDQIVLGNLETLKKTRR
jgi:tetratricopeptide (TPR) repeat protein